MTMKKHFVTFYSPGTFVSEETTREIEAWDVDRAKDIARDVVERYGAKPYGFRFFTRERGETDLDSRVTKQSPMYFLGGKVRTRAQVDAAADPSENVLRANMHGNGIERVVTNTNSWKTVLPLGPDDVVLGWP